MKRKTNVKKYKSKPKTKTKKTNIKTVKKNSIKKTVKTKQKNNPKVFTQKSIIITTTPIIDQGISKISWRNIYDICENAIQSYKNLRSIKDLNKALFDINRIATENGILNDIQFILRSKQTLLDKIKLIKNYCLRKL